MNPQHQPSIDHKERERKSHDKIRVNNPFDKDYPVVWDGFYHVVPAQSYAILDRFLAEKWLEEQCKRIITEEADGAVKAENKRRVAGGMAIMDRTRKTGEQYEFEMPYYLNWGATFPDIIRKYSLYGGVVQEYGMQYVPQPAVYTSEVVGSLLDRLETAPAPVKMASVQSAPLQDSLTGQLDTAVAPEESVDDKKAKLVKAVKGES